MYAIDQDQLGHFSAEQADDELKRDLELTCDYCGDHLCDIEPGDTLGTLVRTAIAHAETCDPTSE